MKNWFARISLLVLLVAVGAWWYHAAQSEDYGPIEQTWYIIGFVFVAALNIGNAVADWRSFRRGKSGNNSAYSVALLLMVASLTAVACKRQPVVSYDEEYLFPAPRMQTDTAGWTNPAMVTAY